MNQIHRSLGLRNRYQRRVTIQMRLPTMRKIRDGRKALHRDEKIQDPKGFLNTMIEPLHHLTKVLERPFRNNDMIESIT